MNKTASLKIAIPAASYGVLRDFSPAGSAAFEKHNAASGGEYNPQRFKMITDDPDLEYLMVDGSIVRVHQHGAVKKTNRPM